MKLYRGQEAVEHLRGLGSLRKMAERMQISEDELAEKIATDPTYAVDEAGRVTVECE
jgi:Tfp pilus assembly protein PilV